MKSLLDILALWRVHCLRRSKDNRSLRCLKLVQVTTNGIVLVLQNTCIGVELVRTSDIIDDCFFYVQDAVYHLAMARLFAT